MMDLPALLDAHALLLPAAGVAAALLSGIHVALAGAGLPGSQWFGPIRPALPAVAGTAQDIWRSALRRAFRLPPARSNGARTRLDPSWLPSQAPPCRRRIICGGAPPDGDSSPHPLRQGSSGSPGDG